MEPAVGCLILLGVMALLFITELGGRGHVPHGAGAQHRRVYC